MLAIYAMDCKSENSQEVAFEVLAEERRRHMDGQLLPVKPQ